MSEMNKIVAVLCMMMFLTTHAKVVYVSELSRHGARAPGKLYNFTEGENFEHEKELTEAGMRQHFLIGHEIRNRYINQEQVINSTYDSSQIEFYMTDSDRAMESAESQISGIFPPEICQQKLDDFQTSNALPPLKVDDSEEVIVELGKAALPDCFNLPPIKSQKDPINYAIHFEASDCQAYIDLQESIENSDEYADLIAPLVTYLKPRLSELTGMGPDLSLSDINNICSYIGIAEFHRLKLKFDYNQTDLEICQSFMNSKMFYVAYGNQDLWRIGSKVFYDNLIGSMDNIITGQPQAQIQLSFSHDYMLSIVVNGLGENFTKTIEFASTLFFELHKEADNKFYVRTLFNDEAQHFGPCSDDLCEYSVFKGHILDIHPKGDIQEICKPMVHFAASPDASLDDLSSIDYVTVGKFLIFAVVFMFIGYSFAKYKQRKRQQRLEKLEFFRNLLANNNSLSESFSLDLEKSKVLRVYS